MHTLRIDALSKSLAGQLVLDDITLTVPAGTRASVVGASGSGKSTLLRLIAGFDSPDIGRITLGERVLADRSVAIPAHLRGVGYVAQDGALFPHLTVEQNIRFGLPRSLWKSGRVHEVAALVAVQSSLLGRYPHELSGGQQQRVALARALAPEPKVILLDEPFSALDTGLRTSTREAVIDGLERSRATTILVTHDQEEALSFGDQIAIIADGRIIQTGEPAAVFENPRTIETARFLGDAILLACTVRNGVAFTALGSHDVRHDRGKESGRHLALVRPSQLSLDFESADTNASIDEARYIGAQTEVTLSIDGQAEPVRAALSSVDPRLCRQGRRVRVAVRGQAVVYPA